MDENLKLLGIAVGGAILGVFLLLNATVLTYETFRYPDEASAATTSEVTVIASVTAEISCSTNISSTDFGTLSASATSTATPNASTTMSCANVGAGCTLYVKDAGGGGNPGLWYATTSSLIDSPTAANPSYASDTLAVGAEGYGLQATTTTVGSGAVLGIADRYLLVGDDVGSLEVTNETIASTTATTSERETVVTHLAAIADTTDSGDYTDTITYECTAN